METIVLGGEIVKRNWILVFLLASVLIVASACGDADAEGDADGGDSEKKVTLKLAVSQPTTHTLNTEAYQPFMERVEELTDGQVKFDYYPAEQLGKVSDIFDLTSTGVADIGLYMSPYYPSKMPLTNGIMTMPGAYETSYEGTMAYHELTKQEPMLERDFLSHGVRSLVSLAVPVYEYWTTGKEIKVPQDFKGLKVRVSGDLATQAMSDLGASPINITVAEMYEALERGVIDSVGLYAASMNDYGMGELVKYGTSGIAFGGTGIGLVVNEKVFQGLPENVQEALVQAGDEVSESYAKFFDEYNLTVIDDFKDLGIEVHELTDDERAEWQKFYEELGEKWLKEKNDPDLNETIEAFKEKVEQYK